MNGFLHSVVLVLAWWCALSVLFCGAWAIFRASVKASEARARAYAARERVA